MRLTEQINLKCSRTLSHLCHLSKNLYNLATYYVRQDLFYLENWLQYPDLWFITKTKPAFLDLPSQTAQQVLILVDKAWKSFFKACKEYNLHPEKFFNRPRPPGYKKKNGEFVAIFTNQQCKIRNGLLYFPKKANLPPIKTRIVDNLHQVRVLPKSVNYTVEIVYEKEIKDLHLNKDRIIGVDLGLTNIVTIVNNAGLPPAIIKGGAVKSTNQYYNKQVARYRSARSIQGLAIETRQLKKLATTRTNKLNDFFHKVSRSIVNYCIDHDFGTIVVGYNKSWKQRAALGKITTQNFVQIPFHGLIHQIRYKSELVGIEVRLEAESFTSKCSFLDNEPLTKHDRYAGRRISRGLFKTRNGTIINADVNAGYNILRKAVPNASFADGIEGVGLHPYSLGIS